MLESGKHVLCEKPLALNPNETAEMIDAAERNGVFFMEGMWMLFQPANVEMRKRMKEEEAIGKPVQVIVNFGRDIDWPRFR